MRERGEGVGLATRLPATVRAADMHLERDRLRPLLGRCESGAELAAPHNAVCAAAEVAIQLVSAAVEPERRGVVCARAVRAACGTSSGRVLGVAW